MREIKFRAWSPSRDVMITSSMMLMRYLSFDGKLVVYNHEIMDCFGGGARLENDHSDLILMQYTGLKDKNGVEIYEGDIVSMHQFLFDGSEIEREYTGVVSWDALQPSFTYTKIYASSGAEIKSDHTSYSAEDMDGCPICSFYGLHEESFTVIGNVHQHPNLLENK